MAFAPSSTIHFCYVPFDSSYKNVVYFKSVSEQMTYFTGKVVRSFPEYLTVRKVMPDGGVRSSVKVGANIDDMYNCNYMMYRNSNHGTRWFYAFVTNLIYINENTTEVVFETDVFQTWLFDVELQQSYVVREHAPSDGIGDNVVPESFSYSDYVYEDALGTNADALKEWGYLIVTSEPKAEGDAIARGRLMSGIYQGLYFYYYTSPNEVNAFLDTVEAKVADCVLLIALIPKFCVGLSSITDGYISSTTAPNSREISLSFDESDKNFSGYKPKNNKLFTSPFCNLVVMNGDGAEAIYNIEEFETYPSLKFKMYGDVSPSPAVALLPYLYKGRPLAYDFGISINKFPQCSFHADSYKLWLAKNTPSQLMSFETGIAKMTAGTVMGGIGATGLAAAGTAVASPVVAGGLLVAGATQVLNTMVNDYKASKEPNRAVTGGNGNLVTAMGHNTFHFFYRKLKKEYAMTVDGFFTMYGYQTNKLKIPGVVNNFNNRPYYCYVQTCGINIHGDIPADDMLKLKSIYDNGVTCWRSSATVGDYTVNNAPQ